MVMSLFGCRSLTESLATAGRLRIVVRLRWLMGAVLAIAAFGGCSSSKPEMMGNLHEEVNPESFYLPNAEGSRVVTVATNGVVTANILLQTQRVAVKETGPKETVEKFGEVYAFSPNFFAVRREEPTRIRFWNLQPDDNHAFMLISPRSQVLMNLALPPLTEVAYVFTFHEEGLYNFVCSRHPNVMFGQILVLPPRAS
jgi:plastocyanin